MGEFLEPGIETINKMKGDMLKTFLKEVISDYLYQRQADYEFLLEGGLKADRIYNCEKTAVYIIEKILSSMQEKKDVKRLIEKIKGIEETQKAIFIETLEAYLDPLLRKHIEEVIAGNNYYLDSFNWNINLTLASNNLANVRVPTCHLQLKLSKKGELESRKVDMEMSREELDIFIEKLALLQENL